jgi:hypothetical protein
MNIRIAAFVLAVVFANTSAQAEAFDRSGYKVGPAIEFLVTRDRKAVDLSNKREAEILALYTIAFGQKLSGEWPDKLPVGFSNRAWDKMIPIMSTREARESGLVFVVGMAVDDAVLFAKRYDRNSEAARRVIEAVTVLVGKD